MSNDNPEIGHIWDIAELLRGDYKRSDYGKVILPFTVLRRLDCILEPTKAEVLRAAPDALKRPERAAEALLNRIARQPFHNHSPFSFANLLNDQAQLAANLLSYINGFSNNIREILEYFSFPVQIERLEKADLLYRVVERFRRVSLPLDQVPTHAMGNIFEELIRRFSEQSNETAGEHFTPREVIKLMVNLLFRNDRGVLTKEGVVRTLYDPACGTGGMLAVAEDYLRQLNRDARLELFGQEINPESYAICKADMVIKGHNAANIKFGNSFTSDGLPDHEFDYMLSNPPFGVEWKKVEKAVRDEHAALGQAGRFGAGLPRISDGSLLFLQHMLSKRKRADGSSRLAIVFNGSPLFSGGASSGESEIRRWIIENDWLEAIVALPDQLFYNTGISTYIWIVTNNKTPARRGRIQLVNAVDFFRKKDKSLGNKRKELGSGEGGHEDHIGQITRIYGEFTPGPYLQNLRQHRLWLPPRNNRAPATPELPAHARAHPRRDGPESAGGDQAACLGCSGPRLPSPWCSGRAGRVDDTAQPSGEGAGSRGGVGDTAGWSRRGVGGQHSVPRQGRFPRGGLAAALRQS